MLSKIVTVHNLVILVEHLSFRAFKGFCAVVTPQLHMGSLVSVCLLCVEMLSRSTKLDAGHLPHSLGGGCSGQLCAYRHTEGPEFPHLLHHANGDAAHAWSSMQAYIEAWECTFPRSAPARWTHGCRSKCSSCRARAMLQQIRTLKFAWNPPRSHPTSPRSWRPSSAGR